MKPGGSKLNPKAAAYVPLYRREGYLGDESRNVSDQGVENLPGPQIPKPEKPSDMVYTQMKDEDMALNYLLVEFSGLSYESVNSVFLANNCDVDATYEMLNQLQIFSFEADQEDLPDTLDIGDVPETIEPTTAAASNQNNASNEASASSSSGIPNASVSSSLI